MYGFQSYISVPILRPDGRFFGTLCALYPRPARLNKPETIGMFKLFADLIGFHLDVQERLRVSETALLDERKTSELREQFIAVLGHDLRNPLASIYSGARLLRKTPLNQKAIQIIELIENSASRMAGLIDNVLDFARGRLGGGFSVTRTVDTGLKPMLEQTVAEMRAVWPDRVVQSHFALDRPVACDSARIAQLLSNLLANAFTHGDPAGPVRVEAWSADGGFEISVANIGEPIPPEIMDHLFKPFSRASARAGQQGLGLGLYIATEIARAHDGSLKVESSLEETRFIFRMPLSGG
jgi:signal transduction histidine kinase